MDEYEERLGRILEEESRSSKEQIHLSQHSLADFLYTLARKQYAESKRNNDGYKFDAYFEQSDSSDDEPSEDTEKKKVVKKRKIAAKPSIPPKYKPSYEPRRTSMPASKTAKSRKETMRASLNLPTPQHGTYKPKKSTDTIKSSRSKGQK